MEGTPTNAAAFSTTPIPDSGILAFVHESGLVPAQADTRFTPLTGGVSSDIWKVEAEGKLFVVKRAMAKLSVTAEWHADPRRNLREVDYLKWLGKVEPAFGPDVLADDPQRCMFAMRWFAPDQYPVWKSELLAGHIDPAFAGAVGERLARVHCRSSVDLALAERFDDLSDFRALRLDPYLAATALKHPDIASEMQQISADITLHRLALVHGDISPKNILVGCNGPVFLDAECATWCDPVFDLAFCLNHLALKAIRYPAYSTMLIASFEALARNYFAGVAWESPAYCEARAARLLPALLLARVDGHSPVEYLDEPVSRDRARELGRAFIIRPREQLDEFVAELRRQTGH
jgi:aminoglycoside phosphotransferase (APT) family kinase protein